VTVAVGWVKVADGRPVTASSGASPSASPTPSAPLEIVTADPDLDVASDVWAAMRATDGSFVFYGPVGNTITPIEAGDADGAWKVAFAGSEPICWLYVFDFPGWIMGQQTYARRALHDWLLDSGRRVGPYTSTRQGPVHGWSVRYRAGSGLGELRAVVGDDRLYEFGCGAKHQRSLREGRRFLDSFVPTV